MNEETMEVMLEESWGDENPGEVRPEENKDDEGAAGADNEVEAAPAAEQPSETVKPPEPMPAPRRISIPRGVPGQPHPLLTRAKENARVQGIERFNEAYPGVNPDTIPHEVWTQVSRGIPLDTAYAMHENQQLRAQLAAQEQMRMNRQRSPGRLGGNSGLELDEMDRLWSEDD